MDILDTIIAEKRSEVIRLKEAIPLDQLLAMGSKQLERNTNSMRTSLAASKSGIIAEFKRKSPSKGWIFPDAQVEEVIPAYDDAGASACSILTDTPFFGGAIADLKKARELTGIPLLRKDFIIDSYQLVQARVMGADAILLIASCLTPEQCYSLAETARELHLEVLLEIHSEAELGHLNPYIDMLGVNNRNLGSFHTSIENSFRLAESIFNYLEKGNYNEHPLLVAESGIQSPETVNQLREIGFRGFLIGETFMKTGNPGDTLKAFIGGIQ